MGELALVLIWHSNGICIVNKYYRLFYYILEWPLLYLNCSDYAKCLNLIVIILTNVLYVSEESVFNKISHLKIIVCLSTYEFDKGSPPLSNDIK